MRNEFARYSIPIRDSFIPRANSIPLTFPTSSTPFQKVSVYLVADMQLYKRLCPFVGPLVHLLVRWFVVIELKSGETSVLNSLCVVVGVWMGVGCPCPPARNDIVTPRHFFLLHLMILQFNISVQDSIRDFLTEELEKRKSIPENEITLEEYLNNLETVSIPGQGLLTHAGGHYEELT